MLPGRKAVPSAPVLRDSSCPGEPLALTRAFGGAGEPLYTLESSREHDPWPRSFGIFGIPEDQLGQLCRDGLSRETQILIAKTESGRWVRDVRLDCGDIATKDHRIGSAAIVLAGKPGGIQ